MTKERNAALAESLVSHGVLKSSPVIAAFQTIDRADFVTPEYTDLAYEDMPLPIGEGQTISQPWTVAFMLELLGPKKGDTILDVGSGSGWTTALLAEISGESGQVLGIERIPKLVSFGQKNISKYKFPHAKIIAANKFDPSRHGPFDKILVSASAEHLPEVLVDILGQDGIMVLPIKSSLWKITKNKRGELLQEEFPGFAFVTYVE